MKNDSTMNRRSLLRLGFDGLLAMGSLLLVGAGMLVEGLRTIVRRR